jgi:hypothetical protein
LAVPSVSALAAPVALSDTTSPTNYTVLACNPTSGKPGDVATCTATEYGAVASSPTLFGVSPAPTGTITWSASTSGSFAPSTCTLAPTSGLTAFDQGGACSTQFQVPLGAAGAITIQAAFTPTDPSQQLKPSSTTANFAVPVVQITSISAGPQSMRVVGQPTLIRASVDAGTGAAPTGSVSFSARRENDGAVYKLGSVTPPGTSPGLSYAFTRPGHYSVTAAYNNGTLTVTSMPTSLDVVQAGTALSLEIRPSSMIVYGDSLTLNGYVTVPPPGVAQIDGKVTFYNGSQMLGSSPVDQNGKASLTVPSKPYLPVGTHTLSAVYSGSSVLKSSASQEMDVTVVAASQ